MLIIINFIVIICFNNNCFIILPRPPRSDICDLCTKYRKQCEANEGNAELFASIKAEWDQHVDEADSQKAMLKKVEADGPTRDPGNCAWRTICTGK